MEKVKTTDFELELELALLVAFILELRIDVMVDLKDSK